MNKNRIDIESKEAKASIKIDNNGNMKVHSSEGKEYNINVKEEAKNYMRFQ